MNYQFIATAARLAIYLLTLCRRANYGTRQKSFVKLKFFGKWHRIPCFAGGMYMRATLPYLSPYSGSDPIMCNLAIPFFCFKANRCNSNMKPTKPPLVQFLQVILVSWRRFVKRFKIRQVRCGARNLSLALAPRDTKRYTHMTLTCIRTSTLKHFAITLRRNGCNTAVN